MELKNGYKVIYDEAADGKHVFSASKTGVFADAEEILRVATGEYKLVYEKAGQLYGSKTGIPADGDHCFVEFDRIFAEAEPGNEPDVANEEPVAPVVEPDETNETPAKVEEQTSDNGEAVTEE